MLFLLAVLRRLAAARVTANNGPFLVGTTHFSRGGPSFVQRTVSNLWSTVRATVAGFKQVDLCELESEAEGSQVVTSSSGGCPSATVHGHDSANTATQTSNNFILVRG